MYVCMYGSGSGAVGPHEHVMVYFERIGRVRNDL